MSDKLITLAKILCVIVGISFSLFMKIFRDPCPVYLQVNYMKNIKTCFP